MSSSAQSCPISSLLADVGLPQLCPPVLLLALRAPSEAQLAKLLPCGCCPHDHVSNSDLGTIITALGSYYLAIAVDHASKLGQAQSSV